MLIAGLLGYHTQNEVRYAQEAINFGQLTFSYVLIVLALGGSLLMWALQEYLRFRHSTRRRRPLPVELSDLALYTKMEESDLAEWQSTRRMVAYHDANGGVLEFNTDNDANLMRA
jgi:poly-beta-1,6-N-acetyl-D-glucosamine biosynthesis protein PgaD